MLRRTWQEVGSDGSCTVVYTEDGEVEEGVEEERIRPRAPECAGALVVLGAAPDEEVTTRN